MSKLLVIFGATGAQGGSVVKSILADASLTSQFRLRGVTRDVSKPASQALTKRGVEMVAGDLDDRASLDKAVQGAYGVFAVTDYWAKMDGPLEIRQGKSIADASLAAGVQHFVLSTLESPTKITNGALSKVEHFETKAEIAEYATSIGLPSTFFLPGYYMSNIPGSMLRKDEKSGKYAFSLPVKPDAQIPLFDAASDTGKYVKAIFKRREQLLGKKVFASLKYYSPEEIVRGFEQVYPKDGAGASFNSTEPEAFAGALKSRGMPAHAAEELLENMLLLNKGYGYYGEAPLEESNEILDEPATTWEEFLKAAPAFKDLS